MIKNDKQGTLKWRLSYNDHGKSMQQKEWENIFMKKNIENPVNNYVLGDNKNFWEGKYYGLSYNFSHDIMTFIFSYKGHWK